jgi:transcription initiation factor TFIIIB Brf1 subunit/transcription initiation factor TFIIB
VKCENCGAWLVVDKGVYVCPACGTVHGVVFDGGFDEERFSGARLDGVVHGSFVTGSRSLKLLQVRLSHGAREQALLRAKRQLAILKHALNLGERECDIILSDFVHFVETAARRGVKLRRAALLLAVTYLRRERLARVNLKALVNELRRRGFRVRLGDVIDALSFLRSEGAMQTEDWETLLRVYTSILASLSGISSERLLRRAEELLTSMRRRLTGRSRRNVAAAVVYVAGELEGAVVPLARYARLAAIPVSSLKANVDLVRALSFLESAEPSP